MHTLKVASQHSRFAAPARCLATLIALLLASSAGNADAQGRARGRKSGGQKTSAPKAGGPKNIALLPIEGPNGAKVRTGLGKSLVRVKNKVKVVPSDRVDSAAGEVGADLSSAQGKVAVARELQISAYVDGTLEKRGKVNAELELRVYDGRTGEVVGRTTVKGKATAIERLARSRFWGKLGPAIMLKTKAPPKQAAQEVARSQPRAAEPEDELEEEAVPSKRSARATEEEESLDEDETPRRSSEEALAENEPAHEEGRELNALEVGLRVRMMTRSFAYNEPLDQIAQHDLQMTPALRLEARWYPAAHFTTGALANLGIDTFVQFMYPVKAVAPRVGEFQTSSSALGFAARYRVPLAAHELGVLAGYSSMSFNFEDTATQVAQVPSVSYGSFKLGGDARFVLTDSISVGASAAYLMVQGFGELSSTTWFPHTSGSGLELELRGGYALSRSFEATLALGVTRYAMSFNGKQTDPGAMATPRRVAGGVTDQYFNGGLGITWRP